MSQSPRTYTKEKIVSHEILALGQSPESFFENEGNRVLRVVRVRPDGRLLRKSVLDAQRRKIGATSVVEGGSIVPDGPNVPSTDVVLIEWSSAEEFEALWERAQPMEEK